MFRSRRHSGDDALVRWYMAERGLDALDVKDEAVVKHIGGCVRCATRYDALCADLDDAAQVSVDAADAVFTSERLVAQRDRILRRIDSHGAKVLAFPAADAGARGTHTFRPMVRWVAVAAAAGLFVGLAAGRILYLGNDDSGGAPRQSVVARTMPAGGQVISAALTRHPGDDVFMSEVDVALSAPRTSELDAIDAMTLGNDARFPRR